MTFIKRNKTLALMLALLLMVAVLAVGMGIAVSASDDETVKFNLSVSFNSENATVFYSVGGSAEMEMVSERVYEIERGSEVKIRVLAKDGYTVKGEGGLFESFGQENERQLIPNKESGETSYIIPTFNADAVYTARCVNRSFDIDFVPSIFAPSGETSLDYTFENGAPNIDIIYGGEAKNIPAPTKEGYIFLNWSMVNNRGEDLGLKEIGSTFQLNNEQLLVKDILETGMIYLRANFVPEKYLVTRYDYVFDTMADSNRGEQLGSYRADVDMSTELNSNTWGGTAETDAGFYGYIGYKLRPDAGNVIKVNVVDDKHQNILRRFYDPIVYTLRWNFNGGTGVDAPQTHVYNADTELPVSTRVGYTFVGWTVIVDGVEVGTVTANGAGKFLLLAKIQAYAATALDEETGLPVIHLRAEWEADRYSILYDTVGGTEADQTPNEHVYDATTRIPDPIRKGYAFMGWYVNGSDVLSASTDGFFTLDPKQMPIEGAHAITLKAKWEPKSFEITLNGNGGGDIVDQLDPPITVTFDSPMVGITSIPSRPGYFFRGFTTEPNGGTLYIDREGNPIGTWQEDGITTLYAQWEPKPYSIIIDTGNREFVESITVNGVAYELGTEFTVKYRETVAIRILTVDGYKLVNWMGGNVSHTNDYTVNYSHLYVGDKHDIRFIIYPVVHAPSFEVDYEKETLTAAGGVIPAGVYSIFDSNGTLWRKVEVDRAGNIKIGNSTVDAIYIPENFFGTTISIVCHDSSRADSDPIYLTVSKRPSAPSVGVEISAYDTVIILAVKAPVDDTRLFQFALSSDATGENLVWTDNNRFENLIPGTTYYVYVRVKHTANEPHSVPMTALPAETKHDAYIIEVGQRLDALKHDGDGSNVEAVIQGAKDAIDALVQNAPYDGFYDDVEQAILDATAAIPLARLKDQAIASLAQKAEQMKDSGSYDEAGKAELHSVLSNASDLISSAADKDEVEQYHKQAMAELARVKITFITGSDPGTDDTVHVTVAGGIDPDAKLVLVRYPNMDYVSPKIDDAIASGKVLVYQNGMTVASALEELRTQDAMAAFRLSLMLAGVESGEGEYEIRLLIPSDLRRVEALRVGYYNEETQTLEILTSRVEDDHLVFTCNRIADFIIFGDPTVSLLLPIILLGATLLIQLIAILFLLVCRKKALNRARSSCAVLPTVALTIRFLPANGLALVIALAAAVILCTVILIWLLLTTDIRKQGQQEIAEENPEADNSFLQDDSEPVYEQDQNALAVFDDDALMLENNPVLTDSDQEDVSDELTDASLYESDEADYRYEYDADEVEGEEPVFEEALADGTVEYEDAYTEDASEEYVEEYVEEETVAYSEEPALFAEYDETDDAEENFIEPAADPMYSLPDEEYAPDEGTEEIDWEADDAEMTEEVEYVEEDEFADIDDSYLADADSDEALPDIDDSKIED